MTDKRTYQRYSPEFKREAVRQLTDTDKSCTQLARELGIRVNQLYKWKQQIDQNQANAFRALAARLSLRLKWLS